jgi:CheY-like chemotaxis protein
MTDDRDVLDVLKAELDFIDAGGYGRSVRTPWKPTSIFEDSLTCLNFGDPNHTHPCSECLLIEFVPPEHRHNRAPCHYIPLNAKGETVASLEGGNRDDLEDAVKQWLRTHISQIEEARSRLSAAQGAGWQKLLPASRGRPRVLVVDDDERMLIALQGLMEDAGYDTHTAWSGQEALRLLRQGHYDLVLLDDYLPGISTEEVLRQLQQMSTRTAVMIMQTATLPDYLAVRYARLGARYFVPKRDPQEVARRADAYFTRQRVTSGT